MGKSRGLFSWILGLLAGLTTGILFAPRKGTEFRQRIKDARKKGKVGHEPVLEDMKKLGEEIAQTAKETYDASVLKDYIEEWRGKLSDLSSEFVSNVSDFHEMSVKPVKQHVKSKVKSAKRKAKRALRKLEAEKKVATRAAKEMERVWKKKK